MASVGAIKAGRAYVELFLRNQLSAGLAKASAQLKQFSRNATALGRSMMGLGLAAGAPLVFSTKTFSDFEQAMATVRAIIQPAPAEFAALTDEAKRLGRTTTFTATQVANGMVSLSRAGFTASEQLHSIADVLDLARATSLDLATAAQFTTDSLRVFGLDASEATRVVDVLTFAANNSTQQISDMGEAMTYASSIAVEAGASMEDVAASLMLLANNGIRGSVAGTMLARAYKNLSQEGKRSVVEKLGVAVKDAAGNMRPLADILYDLGQATAHMGSADKLGVFEEVFGRGTAAAVKFARASAVFVNFRAQLEAAGGTARDTAAVMDDTLAGSFRLLWSAIEAVNLEIGAALSATLRSLAETVKKIAAALSVWIKENRAAVLIVAGLATALIAAGGALILFGAVSFSVASVMGILAAALSAVGTVLGVVTSAIAALFTPMGALAAALAGLAGHLIHHFDAVGIIVGWLGEMFGWLKDFAIHTWQAINAALTAGDLTAAMNVLWASWQVIWTGGVAELTTIWVGFKKIVVDTWADAMSVLTHLAIDAWYGLGLIWNDFTAGMQQAWIGFTTGFMDYWKVAEQWVASGIGYLIAQMEGLDPEEMQRRLNEDYQRKAGERKAKYEASSKEIEKERREREAELGTRLNETKAAADAAAAEAAKRRDAASRQQMDAARDREKKAREAWRKAVEDAKAKAEEEPPEPPERKKRPDLPEFQSRLAAAGGALKSAGAFSARALYGMRGGGGWESKMLAATQQIVKNTKKAANARPKFS